VLGDGVEVGLDDGFGALLGDGVGALLGDGVGALLDDGVELWLNDAFGAGLSEVRLLALEWVSEEPLPGLAAWPPAPGVPELTAGPGPLKRATSRPVPFATRTKAYPVNAMRMTTSQPATVCLRMIRPPPLQAGKFEPHLGLRVVHRRRAFPDGVRPPWHLASQPHAHSSSRG
jgi:hypothetical protein